jgi:hypothetical protein
MTTSVQFRIHVFCLPIAVKIKLRVMKPRTMRWAEHVVRTGELHTQFLSGNLNGRDRFEDLGIDSGVIFFSWRYGPTLGLGLPPRNSLFHFGFLDLRQSVGFLRRVISSSQGLSPCTKNARARRHTNTKHPCPEWDSNPLSRLPSVRRQCMP